MSTAAIKMTPPTIELIDESVELPKEKKHDTAPSLLNFTAVAALRSTEHKWSFRGNAVASCELPELNQYSNYALILSGVAVSTAVKGLIGTLGQRNQSSRIEIDDSRLRNKNGGTIHRLLINPSGYRIYKHKISRDFFHVLAIAKDERLLSPFSDQSLTAYLGSSAHNTPFLPEWVPWLRDKMVACGDIVMAHSINCEAALVFLAGDRFDQYVSEGVQCGALKIRRRK